MVHEILNLVTIPFASIWQKMLSILTITECSSILTFLQGTISRISTYPFPKINGSIAEVWELMSNFSPHFIMDVITYQSWKVLHRNGTSTEIQPQCNTFEHTKIQYSHENLHGWGHQCPWKFTTNFELLRFCNHLNFAKRIDNISESVFVKTLWGSKNLKSIAFWKLREFCSLFKAIFKCFSKLSRFRPWQNQHNG